jgi:hypothetical protein
MPFDATPDQPIESRIIDEALRILGASGEHWIKGSGVADKYCLLHALNVARHRLGARGDETKLRVVEAIRVVHHKSLQIPDFNDDPRRSFAEVAEVLHLARTVTPSALMRKLVREHVSPSQMVEMFASAERKFQAERKKAMATDIGMSVAAIAIMLAGVCIP